MTWRCARCREVLVTVDDYLRCAEHPPLMLEEIADG